MKNFTLLLKFNAFVFFALLLFISLKTEANPNLIVQLDENGNASVTVNGVYSVGEISGTLPAQNNASIVTTQSCNVPAGYVAVGYEGFAGCIVDNFRLISKQLNPDGTLGPNTAVTCFSGGGSTTTFTTSAQEGYALVGFNITDVDYEYAGYRTLLSVQGIGKSVTEIAVNSPNSLNTSLLTGLTGAGCYSTNSASSTQYAPDGHVIVGMEVISSGYSSAVKFNYAPINLVAELISGPSDGNDNPNVTASPTQFTCENLGDNLVTLSVTDYTGNVSSTTATVTVEDLLEPAIECPQDIFVNNDADICGAVVNFSVNATDNCPDVIVVSSPASGTVFPVGETTVTSVATDASGKEATCSFTVTVDDAEAPEFSELPSISTPVTLNFADRAITYSGVSINGGVNAAFVEPGELVSLSYNMSVYFNSSTGYCPGCVVQSYIGIGTTGITLQCESSIYNGYSANRQGITFNAPVTPGTYYLTQRGSLQYQCIPMTFNNNLANAIGVIVVGSAPVPSDIVVSNDLGLCGANVSWTVPTVSDNCGIATLVGSHNPGDLFPLGTTTVTYTAEDVNGNSATGNFEVTVNDDEAPSIVCPQDITANNDPGVCGAVVNYSLPSVIDNCTFPPSTIAGFTSLGDFDGNTFYISDAPFTGPGAFNDAVANGGFVSSINSATENAFVRNAVNSVAGGINILIGFSDVATEGTFVWQNGDPVSYTNWNGGEPNDAGGEDYTQVLSSGLWNDVPGSNFTYRYILKLKGTLVQTAGLTSGSEFPSGSTLNTFLATDAAGNTATCSFTVTVNDAEKPGIVGLPADIGVDNDADACGAVISWTEPTSDDNCSTSSIAQTAGPVNGSEFPIGISTVTYTATDASDNTTVESFTVTVTDVQKPTIVSLPADIDVDNDLDVCGAVVSWTEPTSDDNCPNSSIAQTAGPLNGGEFPIGISTVTYTATDASDNTTVESFTVTVTDAQNPTIVLLPAAIKVDNDDNVCGAIVSWTEPTSDDNCPNSSVVQTDGPANGSEFPIGTSTVTYTATDASNNTAVESFTVTVNNTIPEVTGVTGPATPVELGYLITLTVANNDNNLTNAEIDWDDETGTENISNPASGTFDVSHTYLTPGVYTVSVTLTDACGEVSETFPYQYVVIFDPEGGFVTGGGWFWSEACAYKDGEGVTGKANFGFVAKYKKGSTVPDGNTQFQFKAGGINFHSSAYDDMRLVIAGARANYKGVGNIQGSDHLYGFMVTGVDGEINGGGGVDKFRIKIWDKDDGDRVVYDNNCTETDEDADPSTAIGGGSIVIHSPKTKSAEIAGTVEPNVGLSTLTAYPNPFSEKLYFEFSRAEDTNATLILYDATGRKLSVLFDQQIQANQSYRIEYVPFELSTHMIFYRMTFGKEIINGKIVYKK